jgi:hypothetical protein
MHGLAISASRPFSTTWKGTRKPGALHLPKFGCREALIDAAEEAEMRSGVGKEAMRKRGKGRPELINDLLMTGVRFKSRKGQGELVRTRSVERAA